MSEKGTVYIFACGGKLPRERPLPNHWVPPGGRLDDGRIKFSVWSSFGSQLDRPILPDGTSSPCLLGCKCKRAGGRKKTKAWDETRDPPTPDGMVVTCKARMFRDGVEVP